MVTGQKRGNAEALLPPPDKQVEQDWCGWSWWEGEVLPVPGNAVLSSPTSQCQAPLSPPVSAQRWPLTWFTFPSFEKALASCKAVEQLLVQRKPPELAAETHLAVKSSSESTRRVPAQIRGSPTSWVTITVLFTVLSISSSVGNRNEGTKY